MLSRDREMAVSRLLLRPVREQRRVAGVVELRPRVVRHAAVDRDVARVARLLDRADAVERERGRGRRASGRARRRGAAAGIPASPTRSRQRRRSSARAPPPAVPDSSSTWRIPKPPPTSTSAGVQSSSSRQREANSPSWETASRWARPSASWEPTCTCRPSTSSPAARAAAIATSASSASRPNFEPTMPGPDRLVRLGLDARRDADEHPADARLGCARRLVERVDRDESAGFGGGTQLLVRLVVPVHDQAVAVDPRAPRERELAERGHVGAEAFLGEQLHHGDVRERLRPVDDERIGHGAPEHPRPLPQRSFGVDDERRPEALGELRRRKPVQLRGRRSRSESRWGRARSSEQVRDGDELVAVPRRPCTIAGRAATVASRVTVASFPSPSCRQMIAPGCASARARPAIASASAPSSQSKHTTVQRTTGPSPSFAAARAVRPASPPYGGRTSCGRSPSARSSSSAQALSSRDSVSGSRMMHGVEVVPAVDAELVSLGARPLQRRLPAGE